MVKRFCTVGWALVGLMTAFLVAKNLFGTASLPDPENAFGFACRHLLFPGGLGLLIASILATNMAGCSAFMVDSGALFTRGFYQRYVAPDRSDGHYLWVGRMSGVLITIAAVVYSVFFIERVLYSFLLTETMATFVGISIYAGLIWERSNRWGALAAMLVAGATNFSLYAATGKRLDSWDPTVFLIALGSGIAALIVVSLLTPPEPEEARKAFFVRVNTPSAGEERELPRDLDTAETARQGRQLVVTNVLKLRQAAAGLGWRAYRVDIKGFAVGWAIVAGLVGCVWVLFSA
jgi:Na+/proline symporter